MIATAARWVPCVILALLAVAAGGGLVREIRSRPLPPPPALAEPAPIPVMVVGRRPRGPVETAQYTIIAMRNLFSASRSESTETTLAATGPRPFLHGVVLDGPKSRAYIEDPATRRVFGYALDDPIGGGRLVRILEDRVVIGRPEGVMEIMLKDPSKPRPESPAAPTMPGIPPAPPASEAPAAPAADLPPRMSPQGPK
ncbi:MAG TPA: hypothetical protein VL948_21970 [Verrucomicrobiae bacterium]|jgi:hypothetical protein|nr:hypothetical protein [Verrucomicrobiae bacterium]